MNVEAQLREMASRYQIHWSRERQQWVETMQGAMERRSGK